MADKIGKHRRYRQQEFWAQNGLVYHMDYRDDCTDEERFVVYTAAEMVAKAIQLNYLSRDWRWADEREEICNGSLAMVGTAKDARKQGDPTDPRAAKQLAYDNRKLIFLQNYNPGSVSKILLGGAGAHFDPGMPKLPVAPASKPMTATVSADASSK